MKIQEVITIYDDDDQPVSSFGKTEEDFERLYQNFLIMLLNPETTKYKKIFTILLNKALFERHNLEELKNNKNIYNFFALVYSCYHNCQNIDEESRMIKCIQILVDQYKFVSRYNMVEIEDPKELDIKIMNCYLQDGQDPNLQTFLFSYPLLKEILPFLFKDIRASKDLEKHIILNTYTERFIKELIKMGKIDPFDPCIAAITKEIAEDNEFFGKYFDNYEDNKAKIESVLSFDIENKKTMYNDLVELTKGLFEKIIIQKNKELMYDLNNMFDEAFEKDEIDYEDILDNIKNLLLNYGFEIEITCIDNVMKNYNAKDFVEKFYNVFTKLFESENFDTFFNSDDDFGERGRD